MPFPEEGGKEVRQTQESYSLVFVADVTGAGTSGWVEMRTHWLGSFSLNGSLSLTWGKSSGSGRWISPKMSLCTGVNHSEVAIGA